MELNLCGLNGEDMQYDHRSSRGPVIIYCHGDRYEGFWMGSLDFAVSAGNGGIAFKRYVQTEGGCVKFEAIFFIAESNNEFYGRDLCP